MHTPYIGTRRLGYNLPTTTALRYIALMLVALFCGLALLIRQGNAEITTQCADAHKVIHWLSTGTNPADMPKP